MLKNLLSSFILVENQILHGLKRFIMLLNMLLQLKDLNPNLLTPDQVASQNYSRDRAKVVPRGRASPTISPRLKPMFSLDRNVADSEPYKA